MIEKIIIDYLTEAVAPAYGEEPANDNTPDEYITVEKIGSGYVPGSAGLIDTATVAVKSNAPTLAAAAALNERVKEAMDAITVLPVISRAALNGDYTYTDTARKQRRYQAVFDLIYYNEEEPNE